MRSKGLDTPGKVSETKFLEQVYETNSVLGRKSTKIKFQPNFRKENTRLRGANFAPGSEM